MTSKPLNLHALRAFEAAARHESFKEAAAELSVTPVAVTRHIKQLEADLGQPLFERLHRGVRLTDVGRDLRDDLVPSFSAMHRGVARARLASGRELLRIGCEIAFARHWLAPRLESFHGCCAEIRIELNTLSDDEEYDGIIFYESRQRFGPDRHLLFHETTFPVCSPALLTGSAPLAQPSDLAHHCLLHDRSDDWWQRWLEAAGAQGVRARSKEIFFSHDRLYEAAIEGRGVLMGDDVVYGDDLVDRRLVRLFSETVEGNQFILAVRSSPKRKALDTFVAWILAACQDHKERMKQVIGL